MRRQPLIMSSCHHFWLCKNIIENALRFRQKGRQKRGNQLLTMKTTDNKEFYAGCKPFCEFLRGRYRHVGASCNSRKERIKSSLWPVTVRTKPLYRTYRRRDEAATILISGGGDRTPYIVSFPSAGITAEVNIRE